jgi:hypothetical protein
MRLAIFRCEAMLYEGALDAINEILAISRIVDVL